MLLSSFVTANQKDQRGAHEGCSRHWPSTADLLVEVGGQRKGCCRSLITMCLLVPNFLPKWSESAAISLLGIKAPAAGCVADGYLCCRQFSTH